MTGIRHVTRSASVTAAVVVAPHILWCLTERGSDTDNFLHGVAITRSLGQSLGSSGSYVITSKRKSGGALLGDRIRMNAIDDPRVYMRSLATRQSNLALSKHVGESIDTSKTLPPAGLGELPPLPPPEGPET